MFYEKHQHSGLGLKIIEAIVELHKGRLKTYHRLQEGGGHSVFEYLLVLPAKSVVAH